jgi:N-acetyl sugar amidotransferase
VYIQYCRNCIMPGTKPDLYINEAGICSACVNIRQRTEIDWDARKKELCDLFERYRKPGQTYDCIIPVSGGKDSHFQTIKVLEMGFNPLCVTATTDVLSPIGRRNIENLKRLGVDYIEVTTNPVIRRRINKLALTQVGDISWPEHVTIFTVPVRVAVQMNIPLIIWGENSQNEYGGPGAAAADNSLTRRWLEEFGGLLGLRVTDLIGQEGIEAKHLTQYTYPSDEELARVGVTGLFLGYYVPWDGYQNVLVSQAHGFETYPKAAEGSLVNYENLDNGHTGMHDYFKFLKYAFGRATDHACMHIRRGRLTRAEGLAAVRRLDGKFPWEYIGCKLQDMLLEVDLTLDEFIKICDRFTNKKLFLCDSRGNLIKDKYMNLTKVNYDNVDQPDAASKQLSCAEQ